MGDFLGTLLGKVHPDGETEFGWAEFGVESVWGGEIGTGDQGDVVFGSSGVLDLYG